MRVISDAPTRASDDLGPRARIASGLRSRWLLAAALVVIAAGIGLRFVSRSDLWLDEALTVNISRLPLRDIPDWLRHDGAPPLYYFLLHVWTSVFGTGDVAVRTLSGIFSVATLPAIWFAGRRVGGRMVAWASVLILAASPFAIRYATEARMYSLQMLLVVLGYLALARLVERPSLGRQALVALVAALLLYTQYWSLYLLAVVGVLLVVWALRSPDETRRHGARSALVALVAGGIVFLPWVPTFLYQSAHTGTPWGDAVIPSTAFAFAVRDFSGGIHSEAYVLLVLLIGLSILSLFGRPIDRFRVELDVRTQPGVRTEVAVWVATVLLGGAASYVAGTTFQGRYASVAYPLFVLVVAYSMTVFPDLRVRLVLLGLVIALGFTGGVRAATEQRTQAFQSAGVIKREARPGDLVLYCPDQIAPAAARLLEGRGLQQVTFPDLGSPKLVDWVDYKQRRRRANTDVFARRVLELAGNHTIWFVIANQYRGGNEGKCEGVQQALNQHRTGARLRVQPDDNYFEFMGLIEYPAP